MEMSNEDLEIVNTLINMDYGEGVFIVVDKIKVEFMLRGDIQDITLEFDNNVYCKFEHYRNHFSSKRRVSTKNIFFDYKDALKHFMYSFGIGITVEEKYNAG